MVFELNKPIAENKEEQELITKGKKDKNVRLYGTYIYKVLLEESDEEHTFTVKQLCKRILERFKVYIDITTIRDYLKDFSAFDDYELKGLPLDGYYLEPSSTNNNLLIKEENRLEDYQIHYLVEWVRNLCLMPLKERTDMVRNLIRMCANSTVRKYLSEKPIVRYDNENKQELLMYSRLLMDLPEIISKQLPIEVKLKNRDGTVTDYERFYVYATLDFLTIYIVGTFPSDEEAIFIPSYQIVDYRILENAHFDKIKPKISKEIKFLDEEEYDRFKAEYLNTFSFQEKKEEKMKSNYEKFLDLGAKGNINAKTIKEHLNFTDAEADAFMKELVEEGAVENEKVKSVGRFKKLAKYRFVYDTFYELSLNLEQIIEWVLVRDDRFVKLINEKVSPAFTTSLTIEERREQIKLIMKDDESHYRSLLIASEVVCKILQESEDVFLDLYLIGKADEI